MKSQFDKIATNENEADLIIINSCTVTDFADRDLRKYINSIRNKKIILTGCAAYTQGKEFFESGRVKAVLGHKYKEQIKDFLNFEGVKLGDFDFKKSKILHNFSKTKAFIKIQEGCDFECAYCIIPQVRGYARSMDEEVILKEIKTLAQNGISEFVLTGINMGSYGKDTSTSLSELIKKISDIRGVKRIRLGSLEPSQVNDELITLTQNGILEKHLHIALQHTSDKMLRIMKRRNRVKPTLELFEKIAQQEIALGTDFIVGHPGESEEIWHEALENFKKFPLTHIHVFRFTKREGTRSALLKNDLRGDVVKKRAKTLDEIVKKNNYNFRMKKQKLIIHVEHYKNGYYVGYDQFYNKMLITSDENIKDSWIKIDNYDVKEVNYAKI